LTPTAYLKSFKQEAFLVLIILDVGGKMYEPQCETMTKETPVIYEENEQFYLLYKR